MNGSLDVRRCNTILLNSSEYDPKSRVSQFFLATSFKSSTLELPKRLSATEINRFLYINKSR